MKKLNNILVFVYAFAQSITSIAQSPKDNLLGRYIGTEDVVDMNTGNVTSHCSYAINEIRPNAGYPETNIRDSSCYTNWGYACGTYMVADDSTLRHPITQTYVYGKLFPNDSLYVEWIYYCGGVPGILINIRFSGFKQYGFPAPVGVKERDLNEIEWLLYPNPASDELTVTIPNISEKLHLQLLDVNGKQLLEQSFKISTQLDVGDLPKGVYVLKIMGANANLSKRVVLVE